VLLGEVNSVVNQMKIFRCEEQINVVDNDKQQDFWDGG
jgi:hypothetical protein